MTYGDLPLDAPEKPNKGQEGGACNRRACQAEPALYWNHGSHSWYCADCARDIGEDPVNKRDWELRHRPTCGHAMFETREEITTRQLAEDEATLARGELPEYEGFGDRRFYPIGKGKLYFGDQLMGEVTAIKEMVSNSEVEIEPKPSRAERRAAARALGAAMSRTIIKPQNLGKTELPESRQVRRARERREFKRLPRRA